MFNQKLLEVVEEVVQTLAVQFAEADNRSSLHFTCTVPVEQHQMVTNLLNQQRDNTRMAQVASLLEDQKVEYVAHAHFNNNEDGSVTGYFTVATEDDFLDLVVDVTFPNNQETFAVSMNFRLDERDTFVVTE